MSDYSTSWADVQTAVQEVIQENDDLRSKVPTGKFVDPVIGSDTAAGYQLAPWKTLTTIVASIKPQPGDTIWLRGGVYSGYFEHSIGGTPEAPITFRALPGEIVIIDGYLAVGMPNIIWRDVQFRYSAWTTRVSTQSGSNPSDLPNRYVRDDAANVKFINCILHDMRSPYMSYLGSGLHAYGCISFNHGWKAPDRAHGHSFYVQNDPTLPALIEDCIFFDSYSYNYHSYAEGTELLGNLTVKGCVSFKAGSLGGVALSGYLFGRDDILVDNLTLDSNLSYGNSVALQFYGKGATNVHLRNNIFPEGKTGIYTAVEETGNLYSSAGDRIIIRPNLFQTNRATITIYNASRVTSLRVMQTLLPAGMPYRLINVQGGVDTNGLWRDLVYGVIASDGSITVDMTAASHKVSAPIKGTAPATTFPNFGCLILEGLS